MTEGSLRAHEVRYANTPMRMAIVVPALNESEALRRQLPAALAAADEVVVADGGSSDGSPELARGLGARVVCGPPGRGNQLNQGAAAASSPENAAGILLFLHADTVLPPAGAQAVRDAIAAGAVGGAFCVRFDTERPLLRLGARLINLRTRLSGLPLGDQAQFVRRDTFQRMQGFRDWPILEDLDFAARLKKEGRTVLISDQVTTAARRFVEQGIVRTVATNWLIWFLFLVGVSPQRLARLYRHVR
jgi:rSAM/selenodomain-associated transferase 2